jgi:protein SCO1/2
MKWSRVGLLIVGMALGIGLALLILPRFLPHKFHGTLIQSTNPAPNFTLESSRGGEVSLSDFSGKLVILYFGYTYCPEVCPTTLAQVDKAVESLGRKAGDVQVMMVSVDPERDTPERLASYLKNFNPDFIGASGSVEQIAETATAYGIYFEKHPGTPATGYLVDHTATVLVIDRTGHLRMAFPFGTTAQDMASDLAYLLR